MKLFLRNVGQLDEFKGCSHTHTHTLIIRVDGPDTNSDDKGGLDSRLSKVQTAENHNHNLHATERARTDRYLKTFKNTRM